MNKYWIYSLFWATLPDPTCPWGDVAKSAGKRIGHSLKGEKESSIPSKVLQTLTRGGTSYSSVVISLIGRSVLTLHSRIDPMTRTIPVNVRTPTPLHCWGHIRHLTYLHPEEKRRWGSLKTVKELTWFMQVGPTLSKETDLITRLN